MKGKTVKILTLVMTLVLVAAVFTGCGDKDDGDGQGAKDGVLIAGTEPTFAPFDTTGEDGELIGFDMDLMNAIAKDQGFKVEYKAFEFDALIPALNSENIDIITAGMTSTDPERRKKVDFTDDYYDSSLVVLVKEDNKEIKSFKDITNKTTVASQIGTTGADKLTEMEAEGTVGKTVIVNQFTDCMLQLENGNVDAVFIDEPVAEAAIAKREGLKIAGEPMSSDKFAFAVKKGNEDLLKKINDGLKNVKEDGTYDKLVEKWFK